MVGCGEVLLGARESHGEFAGGVDGSGEDVGEGDVPREPAYQASTTAATLGSQGMVTAVAGLEDDDGVGVGGGYSGDEGVLIVGQREVLGIHAFAVPLVGEDDGDVGLLWQGGCGVRDRCRG